MLSRRLSRAALIPLLGLNLLVSVRSSADTALPGGGNSNPTTGNGPTVPGDGDKPSGDDGKGGPGNRPPGPQPKVPEGKEDCADDQKDPDAKNPNGGPPSAPGSVDLSFSLDACPLEYSIAVGNLTLYFEEPVDNMGDPVYLRYNSVAGAHISDQATTGLGSGVAKRYTIEQLSGKPLSFDLKTGQALLKPSGSGAASRARVELRTTSGVTTDPNQATSLRQYRSAGGYMEFNATSGSVQRWVGPTGRSLDFPADPQTGIASMGLEVIRDGPKIRQIKSTAGLLDIVPDADGRGYRVVTYLPSQIGGKSGVFYTLVANAKPKKTVHLVHPPGTSKLVTTYIDHSPDSSQDRVRVITYNYIDTFDAGHEWTLTTEADGMSMTSTRHVIPDHDKAGMRRIVRELTDGTGRLLDRKETVQQFETGWSGWTDIQEIETPAGDTTQRMVRGYRYGTTPGQNDFGKVNWQMTDTGLVYEFTFDSEGRMSERRRPWLDGTDGQLLIEKYSYTPLVAGEVVLPGDERPRTTTVEVGTAGGSGNLILSRSYFAAYDDSSNSGRHTVINEDAASPSSAFGNIANRRNKQVFYAASTTVEGGRLMEITDEDDLRTQYTYVLRSGGGLIETATGPLNSSGAAKAGLTKVTLTEKDGGNVILRVRHSIFNGSGYTNLYDDANTYAPQGQLLSVTRTDLISGRQRLTSSYTWRGDQMTSMTLADGSTAGVIHDGFDRIVTTSSGAIPAASSPLGSAGYPARPAITTQTTGSLIASFESASWGDNTVTTTGGSLNIQRLMKIDAQGRIYEGKDGDGYTTAFSFARSGLETLIAHPDGGSERQLAYLDGHPREHSGNSLVPEYDTYTPRPGGGLITLIHMVTPDSSRYHKVETDMLGRIVREETPGHGGTVAVVTQYAGSSNRPAVISSSAPQTPARIYEYDTFASLLRKGETIRPAAATLSPSSIDDRLEDTEFSMIVDAGSVWEVQRRYIYPNDAANVDQRYLLAESRAKVAGFTGDEIARFYSLDALGNWEQRVVEERMADRVRIETSTSSAFSGAAVSVYHGNLLVEERRPSDTVSTRMTYDDLGRLASTKQPRHLHADSYLFAAGSNRLASYTDPSGAVTNYAYYPPAVAGSGRISAVTYADGTVRRSSYDLRGNKIHEWGNATPPVSSAYDSFNQLQTLSTYRGAVAGDSPAWPPANLGAPDSTIFSREAATGLLLQKTQPDNKGNIYDYDVAGRLTRRTSARNLVTDFTYTAWGQHDITNYPGSTPDVDLDYDRTGRKSRESNGIATTTFAYSQSTLMPTLESVSYDLDQNGVAELTRQIDRSHDSLRRPSGYSVKDGMVTESGVSDEYDIFGRLSKVTALNAAGTPANAGFTYSYAGNSNLLETITGPVARMTAVWEVDRDTLDIRKNEVSGTVLSQFDYGVNTIGRRTSAAQTGSAFSSARSVSWSYDLLGQLTSADSSISGQDRSFSYDVLGNRKRSADSLTLPGSDNYTVNSLNQYSAIGALSPVYDFDGNATSSPLPASPTLNSTLAWDAENRLISTATAGIVTSYQYDAQGRRISKTTGANATLYLYDGWNCIAEYSRTGSSSPVLSRTNTWGKDLSGGLKGAGGIGGLLSVTTYGPSQTSYYPTYDGNGNVSEYLNAFGSLSAHFEYDPFGRLVVDTDVAGLFDVRFGTRKLDQETGLYYYGYRYYDPLTGRWPSRDPLAEYGGMNLYGFVGNDGVNHGDFLGMFTFWEKVQIQTAGAKSFLYEVTVGTAVDVYGAGKGAVKGYVGLLDMAGTALGNEAWHMTEDFQTGGVKGLVEGKFNRLSSTAAQIAEAQRMILEWEWRMASDPNFRNAALSKMMDTLAKNLLDPDCLEKLMRKIRGEAGLALLTMGASEWAAGVELGSGLSKSGELSNALKCLGETGCFAGGTRVETPDGDRDIKDIRKGDIVCAYEFKSGRKVERQVLQAISNFTYYWVDIEIEDDIIHATRGHRFWVESLRLWSEAAALQPGMVVRLSDGTTRVITKVVVRRLQAPENTYNLIVEGEHDYFVGGYHTLVHNGFPDPSDIPPASGSFDIDHRYSQTAFPELRNDKSLQTLLDSTMNRGYRAQQQAQLIADEAAMKAAGMSMEDIRQATMGEWENLANSVDAYPSGELTTGKYSGVLEGIPCD